MGLLDQITKHIADLNPEIVNSIGGLLNYGKDRAKYIGGLLDDSAPINQDLQRWHKRTQLGLADQLAGKQSPDADYAYSQMMNMAGNAPMGITKALGPRHEAMETARKNAVKMLGLPENNTAMDRARAMGIDTPVAHFSRHGADVSELDSGKFAIAPFDAVGTHVGTEATALDRFNKTVGYKVDNPQYASDELKGVTYPLLMRKGKEFTDNGRAWNEDALSNKLRTIGGHNWNDANGGRFTYREMNEELRKKLFNEFDSIPYINDVEMPGLVSHIVAPQNLRSRFAAFDPARRHEADLLGRATVPFMGATTLGGLLGLEAMRRGQE